MKTEKIQVERNLQADIVQYRLEFIAVCLRWSFIIVLFCVLIFLWVFSQEPIWTTGILLATFVQFLPFCGYCFYLARQNRTKLLTWIYLISATVAATAFALFMSETYLIVGIVGYILFIRVAMFLEEHRTAFTLGVISVGLYLIIILIRTTVDLPPVELGNLSTVMLTVLPILILVLFTFLDRVGTRYLQSSLNLSEEAREALVLSYQALAESEDTLSQQAFKLERQNEELQQMNEELKSFAYIISHDLRAPLINLKGFSSELRSALNHIEPAARASLPQLSEVDQEVLKTALEEDVPEAISFIESSVTRMDGFINALLILARFGHRNMFYEPVDVNEILQTTLSALAHQTAEKKVEIISSELPTVKADYIGMQQIMGNLLSNAINYLQPGRPGYIEIWAESDKLDTKFFVKDNGRGIEEREMPKLFEPFRRIGLHDTPGEGMGLAYVLALVRRHNGRIWCESEPGSGSTFVFTIAKGLENGDSNG